MSRKEVAARFMEACDGGKGWDACAPCCHPDATFLCQADALADIGTLEAYAGWAAGLLGPLPDARYELRSLAEDGERGMVTGVAAFLGTHTGDGPVPPTGKSVDTNYVYVMEFDGDRIRHLTKIWNDGHALRQLGWA